MDNPQETEDRSKRLTDPGEWEIVRAMYFDNHDPRMASDIPSEEIMDRWKHKQSRLPPR